MSDQDKTVKLTTETQSEDLGTTWYRWKCLVCGYTYEGAEKIVVCPKCGNDDPDKFD